MGKEKKESKFVNPFDDGVTYEEFLNSIPKGKTVKEHCTKKITEEQLSWLEKDLEHFDKNKLKTK